VINIVAVAAVRDDGDGDEEHDDAAHPQAARGFNRHFFAFK
jgi:hypothetical protein